MAKIIYSLVALICLSAIAMAQRAIRRPAFPPQPHPTCYSEQLNKDLNFDLSYVCNDGTNYPDPEIEEALYYAADHWRMYLNLTSTCFQEKSNFFMNDFTKKNFYNLKSVCKTKRTMVRSVYSMEGHLCHIVRPEEQKIYYATCKGQCNLGYAGVTGYHCIPRGITFRKFLAYCPYLPNYPKTEPLSCFDPSVGQYDPRVQNDTYRMQQYLLPDGTTYARKGYFTEVSVTLPTYCGCRGYFCNY